METHQRAQVEEKSLVFVQIEIVMRQIAIIVYK
jgi:hypothetical protein